jgi:uncharacterized peroxidase-related enzyme
MSRIPAIDPASATGRVKEVFEGPLKGMHFNIFKSMAASPAALDFYLGASGALHKASLSPKEREVIQLTIGEANQCDYCAAAHTAIGKSVGLTDAQTVEARRGQVSDPKLNAISKFALAIQEKKGFVSDADVAAFKGAGYGDAAIAEVVAGYALAVYTNYFNHVNKTPVDFPAVAKI